MDHKYSTAITIAGAKVTGGGFAPLSNQKATEFIEATKRALDSLKNTKTGAQLITEINASGHDVRIVRVDKKNDGNAQFGGADDLAKVIPLKKVHDDGETELSRVLAQACEDLSGRSRVKKFFRIGKAKPRFMNRDAIARLVGISTADLKAMEEGKKPIDLRTDSKLRVYLYDFLTPGGGDDCGVEFNHTKDNLSDAHKRYLPKSHLWENRPPAIALGHELVHAWRVMVGRVLFDYGWEEEAMTVGLPPFSNMQFTENRIRIEWGGLAVRPDYQHIAFKGGLFDDSSKLGIEKGTNAWQGKQQSLHTEQKMAMAMGQRRKAMGYDDEDDADDF